MSAMEGAQGVAAGNIIEKTFENQCLKNGKKLYLNAKTADAHFTFGTVEDKSNRIPAHKSILAADSGVFETMFYGEMKEPGDIHVSDATEAAFMEFLQYFYLSKVKLTVQNVVGVLHLGEKYDVKQCVDDCIEFLVEALNFTNVCASLGVAILYDKGELMKACEAHILLDTVAVFRSGGFSKCDKNVLDHILKMDKLSCSEVDVFKACMSWVKARIGRADLTIDLVDEHLGELYYGIRFASLTMAQLCALHAEYEPVLTRDFITITKIIAQPAFQPVKFTKRRRHFKLNLTTNIERKRETDSESETDSYSISSDDGDHDDVHIPDDLYSPNDDDDDDDDHTLDDYFDLDNLAY